MTDAEFAALDIDELDELASYTLREMCDAEDQATRLEAAKLHERVTGAIAEWLAEEVIASGLTREN